MTLYEIQYGFETSRYDLFNFIRDKRLENRFNVHVFKCYVFKNKDCIDILNKLFFHLKLKGITINWFNDKHYNLMFNNKTLLDCYISKLFSINDIKKIETIIENNFNSNDYVIINKRLIGFSGKSTFKLNKYLNYKDLNTEVNILNFS